MGIQLAGPAVAGVGACASARLQGSADRRMGGWADGRRWVRVQVCGFVLIGVDEWSSHPASLFSMVCSLESSPTQLIPHQHEERAGGRRPSRRDGNTRKDKGSMESVSMCGKGAFCIGTRVWRYPCHAQLNARFARASTSNQPAARFNSVQFDSIQSSPVHSPTRPASPLS